MYPDDEVLLTLNWHGLELRWEEYRPGVFEASIDLPDITIFIEDRPYPWEHGRFVVFAFDKGEREYLHTFPRYYFSLQCAIDELTAWIDNRKK